jgi:hypothetical protein
VDAHGWDKVALGEGMQNEETTRLTWAVPDLQVVSRVMQVGRMRVGLSAAAREEASL